MKTSIKSILILLLAGLAASIAILVLSEFVITKDSTLMAATAAVYFVTGMLMAKKKDAGLAAIMVGLNVPMALVVAAVTGGELIFIGIFLLTTVLLSGAGIVIRAYREKFSTLILLSGTATVLLYAAVVALYVYPQITASDKMMVTNTPAPKFELIAADGSRIHSADLEGKVVLLNFWATWCSNCLQEMPGFDKVHDTYKDNKNVTILAVNLGTDGETMELAQKFLAKKEYQWNLAFDADTSAFSALKLENIPATVILDKSGHIRLVHTGYNATEDFAGIMNTEIEKLITE